MRRRSWLAPLAVVVLLAPLGLVTPALADPPTIPGVVELVRGLHGQKHAPTKKGSVAWNAAAVTAANGWLADNVVGRQIVLVGEVTHVGPLDKDDNRTIVIDAGDVQVARPGGIYTCFNVTVKLSGSTARTAGELKERKIIDEPGMRPGTHHRRITEGSAIRITATVQAASMTAAAGHPTGDLSLTLTDCSCNLLRLEGRMWGKGGVLNTGQSRWWPHQEARIWRGY